MVGGSILYPVYLEMQDADRGRRQEDMCVYARRIWNQWPVTGVQQTWPFRVDGRSTCALMHALRLLRATYMCNVLRTVAATRTESQHSASSPVCDLVARASGTQEAIRMNPTANSSHGCLIRLQYTLMALPVAFVCHDVVSV